MKKIIYCLVKIFKETDEAYANLLLENGELYCQALSKFREIEDNDIRGDKYESVSHWLQPDNLVMRLSIPHNLDGVPQEITITKDDLAGPVIFQTTEYDNHNILCMYAIAIDAFEYQYTNDEQKRDLEEKIRFQLKEQIRIDERINELGKFAVVIFEVDKFFERINEYCKNNNLKKYRAFVSYFDEEIHNGTFYGAEAIFKKRKIYSWQKEYRFAFDMNGDGHAKKITIGSLKDIAFKTTVDEIKNMIRVELKTK